MYCIAAYYLYVVMCVNLVEQALVDSITVSKVFLKILNLEDCLLENKLSVQFIVSIHAVRICVA